MTDDKLLFADDDDDDDDDALLFAEEDDAELQQESEEPWKVLIIDDDAEIHHVTQLTLANFSFRGRGLQFIHAYSADQACEILRSQSDIALTLLDVVMERDQAGFEVVAFIRNELKNNLIRILLRTGQPGLAPERQSIEAYDIDGYLPKAELTSHRLFVSVRTGLKAYAELIALNRHQDVLALLHASAISLHAYEPIDATLWKILQTALAIAPSPLVLLDLQAYDADEQWQHYFMHLSSDSTHDTTESVQQYAEMLRQQPEIKELQQAGPVADGYFVPLRPHRDLGYGWLFVQNMQNDHLTQQALNMLGAHASNSLYSIISMAILQTRERPMYDTIDI